jgi:hypothetical protein
MCVRAGLCACHFFHNRNNHSEKSNKIEKNEFPKERLKTAGSF